MAYKFINFDRSEGVGTVTLNRPEQLNAFTPEMLAELLDVFRGMERDPQVRAIIVTGAGKAFCGGEDFRQRAEAELSSPLASGSISEPAAAPQPFFDSFSSNFKDTPNGGAPYNPSFISNQSGPQPALASEFSPLNPGPVPLENSTGQAASVPSPVEISSKRGPLFNSYNQSQPPLSLSEQVRQAYNPLLRQIRQTEKPVIAAVNGIAAGTGFGLAMACDIRYAAERARFVEVSVRIGLLPGSGAAYFLPRLIGLSKALEIAFNGDELNAAEAERYGLVSRVMPADTLLDETRKLAVRLAKGPTRAIGLTKNLLYKSANLTLDQSLELEASMLDEVTLTQDYKEGLRAFLDKRPPNYLGK